MFEFGEYVQDSSGNNPSKNNLHRTINIIYIRFSYQKQNDHEEIDLKNGNNTTLPEVMVCKITPKLI